MPNEILKMAHSPIKLDNIHYAMLTTDEVGVPVVYGEIKKLPGGIDVTITPNAQSTPQYADNGKVANFVSAGDVNITVEMTALPTETQADWLGHMIDERGGIVENKDDTPDYFAFGFRTETSEGKQKLVWLYKVKAAPPEEKYHTLAGDVTYSTTTTTLSAETRNADGNWKYSLLEGDPDVDPADLAAFFDSVMDPQLV